MKPRKQNPEEVIIEATEEVIDAECNTSSKEVKKYVVELLCHLFSPIKKLPVLLWSLFIGTCRMICGIIWAGMKYTAIVVGVLVGIYLGGVYLIGHHPEAMGRIIDVVTFEVRMSIPSVQGVEFKQVDGVTFIQHSTINAQDAKIASTLSNVVVKSGYDAVIVGGEVYRDSRGGWSWFDSNGQKGVPLVALENLIATKKFKKVAMIASNVENFKMAGVAFTSFGQLSGTVGTAKSMVLFGEERPVFTVHSNNARIELRGESLEVKFGDIDYEGDVAGNRRLSFSEKIKAWWDGAPTETKV